MENKKIVPNPPPPDEGHRLSTGKKQEEFKSHKRTVMAHLVIVFVDSQLMSVKGFTNFKDADKLYADAQKGLLVLSKRYVEANMVPPHIHVVKCSVNLNGNLVFYKGTKGAKSEACLIAPYYYSDENPNKPKKPKKKLRKQA